MKIIEDARVYGLDSMEGQAFSNDAVMLEVVGSLGFEIRNASADYAENRVEARVHS